MSQDILIIAEHDNSTLKSATLHTLSAATQLPGKITLLVAGFHCQGVVKSASKLQNISKIIWVDDACYAHHLAENMADLITHIAKDRAFAYLLAPATTFGKNIMPRVAALLDVGQISEIIRVISADTFVRPIYAGNALATVQSLDPIKVITIRSTAFEILKDSKTKSDNTIQNGTDNKDNLSAKPNSSNTTENIPVEELKLTFDLDLSHFNRQEDHISERPELTSARVVVAGGRGLGSAENFKLIEELADCLNGAIGASRAAVDAGYVSNDCQVGQTGKVVAPELYIAIGISGAIQHLAGMKDSKVIVAINQDSSAPIFQVADYGLVGDLFIILPALIQELAHQAEKISVV